jgi:hypothetical protein
MAAGRANGDIDSCSSGMARAAAVPTSADPPPSSPSSASTAANGAGRFVVVTGNRTNGVDIGDGDRGP